MAERPHKRVALFGMSGLGKTRLSAMLREEAEWFHYSVDFRIGTRYMGEHIVDNFKREAMRNPFLRKLLRTDSIYIASNITFQNLAPLSTYLGKPGDPEQGGIPFEEYVRRQRQHRAAEIAATRDALIFIDKARRDLRLRPFRLRHLGLALRGGGPGRPRGSGARRPRLGDAAGLDPRRRGPAEKLAARFDRAPKPMYYDEAFLRALWAEYLEATGVSAAAVDPNDFIRVGYRRLLAHRLPRYRAIAAGWGVTVDAADVAAVRDPRDFEAMIAAAIAAPGA